MTVDLEQGLYRRDDNQMPENATSWFVRGHAASLPIVQVIVTVRGSKSRVRTYALIDLGSTSTFCAQKLVQHTEEKLVIGGGTVINTHDHGHILEDLTFQMLNLVMYNC